VTSLADAAMAVVGAAAPAVLRPGEGSSRRREAPAGRLVAAPGRLAVPRPVRG